MESPHNPNLTSLEILGELLDPKLMIMGNLHTNTAMPTPHVHLSSALKDYC